MIITFLGDVHAQYDWLLRAMDRNPRTDLFIQVGDMGVGFDPYKLPDFPKPLLFVDGNHDHHDLLQDIARKGDLQLAKNMLYIPRGSSLRLGSVRINCIGGARSIDQARRTEGLSWWREEIPSYEEFDKFASLPPADIVVTHTAPWSVCKQLDYGKHADPVSHTLDKLWEMMPKHTPRRWFFGHFHKRMYTRMRGTDFHCLPCVHPHEDEEPFFGFTLEV